MAKVDLDRRAEIGREKRARTRAQILGATEMLLAERPPEALTVDAIVGAAGLAKGTFYHHFQSIEELIAAIGDKLGESLDDLVAPLRAGISDPIARLSFGLTKILEKAIAEPLWARLVIQRAQAATEVHQEIRTNLKADLEEAIAQRRLAVADVEFAADVVIGICIEVARGTLLRRAAPNLPAQALASVLRALGATRPIGTRYPAKAIEGRFRQSRAASLGFDARASKGASLPAAFRSAGALSSLEIAETRR